MIQFTYLPNPQIRAAQMPEALGLIPHFLSLHDKRAAAEQFNENYAHGGGWCEMDGWEFFPDDKMQIRYTGNEEIFPFAYALLREETIFIYPSAWVLIMQPSKSFSIARLD